MPDSLPLPISVTYTQRLNVTSSVMEVPFTSSYLHTVALTSKFTGYTPFLANSLMRKS